MYVDKAEIDRVKQSHDLVEVIRASGVVLKKQGKQWVGCCPFHKEKTPSFFVDPVKHLWHCFGACNEGGDIYKWVMKIEALTFPEAHRRLGGCDVSPPLAGISDLQWLELAVSHYHKKLLESPTAQAYLKSRGLATSSAVAAFRIGFSDGSLIKTLSPEGKKALTNIGVISQSGKELMQGCLIFPLKQATTGEVVSLYGRHIKRKLHLYLPGPRRGLFNPEGAKNTDTVILTESVIDAAALWVAGFVNALPIYGVNGLTEELIDHLKECRAKRAILMLDSDPAGQTAIGPIAARLEASLMQVRLVNIPAKDPAEFFANGGLSETIHALISQSAVAVPLSWERPLTETNEQPIPSDSKDALIDLLKTAPDGAISLSISNRHYRIRGLSPTGLDRLKINLRLATGGTATATSSFHIDTLDLYQARSRAAFAAEATKLTGIAEKEIAQDLLQLIEPLEMTRLTMRNDGKTVPVVMSAADRDEALVALSSPLLIKQIVEDIFACGLIGESDTVLTAYLAATSRKLKKPLSVLVIARSGAGKSSLQEAIVNLMPSEDVVKVTRLTGQALFYKDTDSLKNKILAIAEVDGASAAAYSLRTLISEQYLSVASPHTDPKTGKLKTGHNEVHGPVVVLVPTTSPEAFDEETRNRFVQLTMDESTVQTEAILQMQRSRYTIEGIAQEARAEKIKKLHQNMQRLLRPLLVLNPYMNQLRYPNDRLISRREQEKYITLIHVLALLHQYQRPIRRGIENATDVTTSAMEYVEVHKEDIAIANRLAQTLFWRSFDELAPPVRTMHQKIMMLFHQKADRENLSFSETGISRRGIQKATGWSYWQVRDYCGKLVEMEYLLLSGGNGKPTVYKLACSIDENEPPSLSGLTDVAQLK